jgi:hypothetical protein
MAIVQPLHAQTWAWPGWAFIRELISPGETVTVSFVQEIRSESPQSHEKPSVSCHCERSEAISWPIGGLLRRLRSALLDQAEPGDTLFARALRSHFEPG